MITAPVKPEAAEIIADQILVSIPLTILAVGTALDYYKIAPIFDLIANFSVQHRVCVQAALTVCTARPRHFKTFL
jgi:hypothetical protein